MRKFVYVLLAASLMLASCRKDDILPPSDDPEEQIDPSDPGTPDDPGTPSEPADTADVPRERVGRMPRVTITVDPSDFEALCWWDKDTYIKGTISFEDPDGWYSDSTSLSLGFQMKGRGNTSWGNEKKPFRLKLDSKHRVFGMKGNKDWVLIANYNDKSLLRNTLGFKVSKICGLAWTPKVRACDVTINGKDYGSYLLVQHKEVAGEKVDIHPELNDYYIEVETSGNDYRIPLLGTPIYFKDPTLAEMGATREKYIRGYLNDWGAAVVADNFEKVYEMMDVDSFVNFFIVEELAKNIDGNFRKSTFMTKVDGQKLVLYHVWDFDIAFGNCDYMHSEFLPDSRGIYGNDPTGWYVKVVDERKKSSGLYQHLFKDPSFVARVKARWQEVYPSLCELPAWLEEEAAVNRESYDRNFQIWHILGTYVWPNPSPIPSDYDGELAFLKDFLSDRLEWMNSEISKW